MILYLCVVHGSNWNQYNDLSLTTESVFVKLHEKPAIVCFLVSLVIAVIMKPELPTFYIYVGATTPIIS